MFHGVSDRFVVRLFWWPPGFPKDSDFTAQEWRFSEWRTQVAVNARGKPVNLMEPLGCGGVVLPPLGGKVGKVGLISLMLQSLLQLVLEWVLGT